VIEQGLGTVFVGRERELRDLLRALDDAEAGRGSLLLLAGEPGIGKSRLADELASRAREKGARVLWGKCWEEAGAPAYWPWVQALRSYLRSSDPEQVRAQLGQGAGAIAQMLPEIESIVPDLAPPPPADPESARFRLFDATTTFLVNASRDTVLVLVIDDLHAADTASIRFLRFLASQLAESRILVVATYRDVELTPDHPLSADLSELTRESITRLLPIAGLSQSEVGDLIEVTAGRELRSQLVSVLWHETGGNPLFLGEAVRMLSAEGRLDEAVDPSLLRVSVPPGVRDVITRRVRQLGPPAVRTLTLGAVLGPEFSLESLRSVGEYGAEELLDLLDGPLQAGLLIHVPGSLGRLRFSHDLVRETLYRDLAPATRVRLHSRVALALEALYGADADTHLAELAHHFFEAARGGDASRAVSYARDAGDEAVRSLAYEEAVRFYTMGLQALELAPSADADFQGELLLALGDAQARAGDLDQARATFLRVTGIARRTGAASQLAHAALGYGGRFLWARAGNDPHTISLLQDALVMLGGTDEHLRVRLLARLSCALRSSPDREHRDALSQQAVEIARRLGDPATLGYALEGRFGAIWVPENPGERLEIAREAIQIAKQTGDHEREATARMGAEAALADLGRMDEARGEAALIARSAGQLGQPAQRWLAAAIRSQHLLFQGDFAKAEPLILEELRLESHPTSIADDVSAARSQLFILRRDQGRLAEMEESVRASIDEFPWYPLHRSALALLLAELGRENEGRAVFDGLARDGFAALYRDNEWLLGMAFASEACALLGDSSRASDLYDQLRPFAGRHAMGHAEGAVGAVDRYLGLLANTMGRTADAKKHLSDAVRLNERMGGRPWTTRSRYELARVLLEERPANRAEAARLLREARETVRELGMSALDGPIESLRSAPLEAADAPMARPDSARGLFHREGEYWTVAFEGDSFRIRDAKGMRYLARLLVRPGQEQHALDLARMDDMAGAKASAHLDLKTERFGDAGALLDPEAKAAYRRRLDELRSEADEADAFNDPERSARARQEMEFLADELGSGVGLGGRDRKAASVAERARISVTRAIRAALERIGQQSPLLGRHFEATIRTGTFCSYNPDPRVPISWEV
jgi:hypothetical protein